MTPIADGLAVTRDPARGANRWSRPLAVSLTLVVGLVVLVVWALRLPPMWTTFGAVDYWTYLAFAERWLHTGSMYLATQLAGPFEPRPLPHVPALMPSMYPPQAVYLFAPFLVLPAVLWWAVPLGVLGYMFRRWRPAPWTWPLMLVLLLPQESTAILVAGNTTLWMAAALAAGLLWGWPAVLLSMKPTLFLFAVVASRHRSFWATLATVVVLCVPFGWLWLDYIAVVRNAEADIFYNVWSLPWLILPIIAWAGRARMHSVT